MAIFFESEPECVFRSSFEFFDIDKNQLLTRRELKDAMSRLEGTITKEQSKQIMDMSDKNGDSKISYAGKLFNGCVP